MNRRHFSLGAMALGVLLSVTACGAASGEDAAHDPFKWGKTYPTYRYRLTIEVDTPEGLKTGSSVIEVKSSTGATFGLKHFGGGLITRARGEAVTVDLGPRGLLFALLRSDDSVDWAAGAFEAMAPKTTIDERMKSDDAYGDSRAAALALKGPQVVPRWREPRWSGYPMLVRFGDIADPRTVAKVDPDALAVSFGKGTKLRRITVERTEDAVTTGIERRLAWLVNYYDKMLDGGRNNNSTALANNLGQGDFSKGIIR